MRSEQNLKPTGTPPFQALIPMSAETWSFLLLVSDYQIYRDFVRELVAAQETAEEGILYGMFFGTVSSILEESRGVLEVLDLGFVNSCENEIDLAKRLLDALSKMDRYPIIFFDPLSQISQLYSDDSAPAYIMEEAVPFLRNRKTLAYFCLNMHLHKNETMARCKDAADVCLQVTRKNGMDWVHPIKVRGAYTEELFLPHIYQLAKSRAELAGAKEKTAAKRQNARTR